MSNSIPVPGGGGFTNTTAPVSTDSGSWTKQADEYLANIPILGSITGSTNRYNNELEKQATAQAQQFQQNSAREAMKFEAEQAALTREFNAAQAEASREWSEKMDSTKYQRQIADMQAAGLNPILAYQQLGSNTPAVSTASSGSSARGSSAGSSAKANLHIRDYGMDILSSLIPWLFMGVTSAQKDIQNMVRSEQAASMAALNSARGEYYSRQARKIAAAESAAAYYSKKYKTRGFDRL